MASGSSVRNNSASKGFDFASDDILCSYEDYGNEDAANGTHSDSAILTNSNKEFNKSRMVRSTVHPAPACAVIDESSNHEMMTTIDKTMKRHSDNLMRFLEGLSSRLSQLELYCYNVDKSIGELRSDLVHDHVEQDTKLKSLEKHLQEVHRSVQILRDKQELADAQKELAKLQLAQKEPSDVHSNQNKDRPSVQSSSESKKPESVPDLHGQQLALALTHQVTTSRLPEQQLHHQQPIGPPPQTQPTTAYYVSSQPIHGQFMPSETQYRPPQLVPQLTQVNQPPQYQQWSQQILTPHHQSQIRPQTSNPGYTSPADPIPYGFNGPVRTVQSPPQPQPQSQPSLPPNTYVIYEGEGGGRTYRPSQPTHYPMQNPQTNQMNRPPQFVRTHHQYGDIVEKTISMGYRGDHVSAVIQRMEESGQPIDFNGVLDRLNGGQQQRGGWSG